MAEPQQVITGLAKLAVTVKEKADQAESNQVTCKLLAGHIQNIIPVLKKLEDNICESDDLLADFVEDLGGLLVEIRNRIDKVATRNMATKMLKATGDEQKLNVLEKRLEQMSHRATFQTLQTVTEIKDVLVGKRKKKEKQRASGPLDLQRKFTYNVDLGSVIGWTVMKEKGLFVISGQKKSTGTLGGTLRKIESIPGSSPLLSLAAQAGAFGDENLPGSYLFVFSAQGGSLKEENMIKPPCQHKLSHLLGVPVRWKEYLAMSCSDCKDIKLMDLTTPENVTTAFSGKPVGAMCAGWHKLYVHVVGKDKVLELDCSTSSFIQTRKIKTGARGVQDVCFIPRPIRLLVACGEKEIYAVYSDKVWSCEKPDKKKLELRAVVFSPRHDVVMAADSGNARILVMDQTKGRHTQSIDMSEIGYMRQLVLDKYTIYVLYQTGDKVKITEYLME